MHLGDPTCDCKLKELSMSKSGNQSDSASAGSKPATPGDFSAAGHQTHTAVDIPLPGPATPSGVSAAREQEDKLLARAWETLQSDKPLSGAASSTMEAPVDPWDSTRSDSIPGYEILHEIHRGGQGVVYQAIQKATKRKVAIKVMKEGPFAGARDKARFEREVQILGQLNHPNIVTIHDSGTAAGSFYYVMDYISGQSLDAYIAEQAEKSKSQRVKKSRSSSGKSGERASTKVERKESLDQILKLFAEICEAVNAAHLRGVIHRDLKPGNICVDTEGHPHILDFGLAKVATGGMFGGEEPMLMTMTGQFVGSLPWASPEQAEGAPGKIDIRTDVYSLGVILYQMLTGRFPYEVIGNIRDVLDNILMAEPARPSTIRRQINDEIETIVLKCLAKDRERRYQSAGAVAEDLKRYMSGEPIMAKRDSAFYVLRKLASRHAYITTMVVAVTVTLISAASISLYFYRQEAQLNNDLKVMNNRIIQRNKFFESSSQALGKSWDEHVYRMTLGWFLLELQNGREDRAKHICERVRAGSPEQKVMSFLLTPSIPQDKLLASLGDGNAGIAYFAIGERNLGNKRTVEAIKAYKACIAASPEITVNDNENWIRESAMARLRQLEGQIKSDAKQQSSNQVEHNVNSAGDTGK
jgi:serine/threonine protein kinase